MSLARHKSRPSSRPLSSSYDEDLYAWALSQASALRDEASGPLDRDNLAAEIEALARSQFDRLVSFLRLVIMHMLKCEHQSAALSRSWLISIATHREHVREVLADNPSLRSRIDEAIARAHKTARLHAADETGRPVASLPEACPYTFEQILDRPYPVDMAER